MRTVLSIIILASALGCSQSREEAFSASFKKHLFSIDKKVAECRVNGKTLREGLEGLADKTPFQEIEFPFLCYLAIEKANPGKTPLPTTPGLSVRWNGVFDQEAIAKSYRQALNYCFTMFMVTSNDVIRVLSFEKFRNNGNCVGADGRFFKYCNGTMHVSIWDGILPDLNHPEEIFKESFKEVVAVASEHPFNYCYYLTPDRLHDAVEELSKQRLFRLIKQSETNMTFVSESVLQYCRTK